MAVSVDYDDAEQVLDVHLALCPTDGRNSDYLFY